MEILIAFSGNRDVSINIEQSLPAIKVEFAEPPSPITNTLSLILSTTNHPPDDIILCRRDSVLRKALAVGYYGYGNFGDELLLKAIRKILKSIGFNTVGILYPKTQSSISGVKVYKRFSPKEVVPAIKNTDVVIFGGGGLFQDVTSLRSFLYYYTIAKISIFFRKPVIFLGTSFGPLKKNLSRLLIRDIVRSKYTFFLPRDRISVRYIGYLGGNVHSGMDIAVEYLKNLDINCAKKYDVLIVPKSYDNFWKTIVNILKAEGRNVKIFIASNEDIKSNLNVYNEEVSIGLDIEKIACSNLVLSERFHPNLVAMYYGVPFVSVNSKKTEYFSKEFFEEYKGFSKRSIQDVLIRSKMVEKVDINVKEKLEERYDMMIEKLRDLTKNL